MTIKKTFIRKEVNKRFGDDADKIDVNAYSDDSTLDNLRDDIGYVPKSNAEMNLMGADARFRQFEEQQAWKDKIKKQEKKIKSGFFREDLSNDVSLKELKKDIKEKQKAETLLKEMSESRKKNKEDILRRETKAKSDVRNLRPAMRAIEYVREKGETLKAKGLGKGFTQATRSDRLAKKEMRVREYQDRLRRLRKAERQQARLSRGISRILSKRKKENLMSSAEYRAMYGQPNTSNDGNMLHTPNLFQNGPKVQNYNILSAQNLVLQSRKGPEQRKMKWL